jgi:hypothetical protein
MQDPESRHERGIAEPCRNLRDTLAREAKVKAQVRAGGTILMNLDGQHVLTGDQGIGGDLRKIEEAGFSAVVDLRQREILQSGI